MLFDFRDCWPHEMGLVRNNSEVRSTCEAGRFKASEAGQGMGKGVR